MARSRDHERAAVLVVVAAGALACALGEGARAGQFTVTAIFLAAIFLGAIFLAAGPASRAGAARASRWCRWR